MKALALIGGIIIVLVAAIGIFGAKMMEIVRAEDGSGWPDRPDLGKTPA